MNPDRFERVREIFTKTRELALQERAAFLERECVGDSELRQEIEGLLVADEDPLSLRPLAAQGEYPHLASVTRPPYPETQSINTAKFSDRTGQTIGPYKVLEKLGEGGMGVVYLAEQTEPIRRRVALKIIKLGMDTKAVVARFESERQALALMNHPNVAKVLDAGATPQGRPYFVMEHVKGEPLTDYCDRHRMTTAQRLELFTAVCEGVQHAHQKAIIHRDLKPSNILVTVEGGKPVPKIIDFGVAKAAGQKLTEKTLFTEQGQLIGTPEYMSPEQAEMTALDIDTRTDIYSLGVILYQLLVGALPFDSGYMRRAAFNEIQRIIREEEPPKPSTRLSSLGNEDSSTAAAKRRTDRAGLERQLSGDLDWITIKAMDKDRTRRYETARELAADIRRHLEHEPVVASPPSATYRAKKFLRRNRGPVTAIVAVVFALAIGLVVATTQYYQAVHQRQLADAARAESDSRYKDILRLADVKRLADAKEAAQNLWPAYSEKIESMQAWLTEQARPLRNRLELHRSSLASLRKKALPNDEEQKPSASTQRTWVFATLQDQWRHDTLAELVYELTAFVDPDPKKGTLASVEARLEFARTIEHHSVSSSDVAAAWLEARDDIATLEIYGGLNLRPQIGLVPLRRDPQSGLWEFWHVQTGTQPKLHPDRDAVNPWKITGDTGLIFVLLPGGTFHMGTQKCNPDHGNYDPSAEGDESPVHEVTLDPFFMSKFEMTQGQWERFTGANPSQYGTDWSWNGSPAADEPIHQNTGWNPVEHVSWENCQEVLQRLVLVLPTEAQWEYAARAGSDTPWWCGAEKECIGTAQAGNVADGWSKDKGVPSSWQCEDWEDGWVVHAPVGSFRPNRFGLHDTIGNVWEWCRGWYRHSGYDIPGADGDGERRVSGDLSRVSRGGSWRTTAASARSAYRRDRAPVSREFTLGLRPSREYD